MTRYIGRFAPSPSGSLHMGSLVTAVGSYLDARINQGLWRLRIDDIDPPRIVSGAIDSIQRVLESHGLHWDGPVYFQSQHLQDYQQALDRLITVNKAYRCDCTRKQIKMAGQYYQGVCRNKQLVSSPFAWRFRNTAPVTQFSDLAMGEVRLDYQGASEDFVIKRRDGLFAYHLASVVDDINMQVTRVIRGQDLLLPTACQISLFNELGYEIPEFMHLPLVCFDDGRKYSKQNHAPVLEQHHAEQNLCIALKYLNLSVPDSIAHSGVAKILEWATHKWSIMPIRHLN